jgi:hypothetical protein
MKIGTIEINWHRGSTTTLREAVLEQMKTDPEVRVIAAKMARSEVKNYLAALAEEADYAFDSPAGFLRAIRVNISTTNLPARDEDEPYDQEMDAPFNVIDTITVVDKITGKVLADGEFPSTVINSGIPDLTNAPPLSLKCKVYGDQSHTPCSGTVDDGTNSLCTCQCHMRWRR